MKRIAIILFSFFLSILMTGQKSINLNELSQEQLELYNRSATTMRNQGIVLTAVGSGVAVVGLILVNHENNDYNLGEELDRMGKWAFVSICGGISAVVGIPLWIIGNNRKSASGIVLMKYDVKTDNSIATGLGLKVMF